MIIKMEVEIGDIEEGYDINEMVREEIVSRVVRELKGGVLSDLQNKTQLALVETVENETSLIVGESIKACLSEKFDVTDKWGTKTAEQTSIDEIIRNKVKEAIESKTLDNNGRYARDNYDRKHTAVDWAISKFTQEIPKTIEAMVAEELKRTTSNIEEMVKQSIKTNVADGLTTMIMENSTALKLSKGAKDV